MATDKMQRRNSTRFDSVTLHLGIVVPNREHDARREGDMRVSRGDAVRLLLAGGSSRRVGKPGYGRQVETQSENRRPTTTVIVTAAGFRPTERLQVSEHVFFERPHPFSTIFGVVTDK